jgi:putative Holliday junction resolvase
MVRRLRRRPGRKLLGLDLGERWIGVAVTDETGVLASPSSVVDLRRASLAEIARLARALNVAGVVVGLPRTMSGTEGFQARRAREQAAELARLLDVPVVFWDERLTTAMADQIVASRGRRQRGKTTQYDALAAAIMLQSYVDAHPFVERE